MEMKDLKKILKLHEKWLNDEEGGKHANLQGADLQGADLGWAYLRWANLQATDLQGADLRWAYLREVNLREADASGADLHGANLRGTDLQGTNLHGANLQGANLYGANLQGANLSGANLQKANLHGANLKDVFFDYTTLNFAVACPEEGSFIGYKKASGKIVVLEIPADAKRTSATTSKCRCDKAKVLRIEELGGDLSECTEVASDYNKNFIYKVGETVSVDDFDPDRWSECSTGIHFFINRDFAKNV